jgi:sulfate/thiosulfate transport system ATP-binding protein
VGETRAKSFGRAGIKGVPKLPLQHPRGETENSSEAGHAAVISVRGLTKSFGGQPVLSEVSLQVAAGESLVILGPSGGGKSTLLRIIAGLETPDTGEVLLGGRPATHLLPRQRGLGVVFQDYALFRHQTVEENIAFGLRMRGVSAAETAETVGKMLDLVRLREHRRKYPAHLSGGQRQRVAIARALAYRPAAILFDEAFSALDDVTRLEMRREIRALLRAGNTPAIFITHNQEEALEIADRIAVLNRGCVEQVGTPFEIYNRPQTEFVATFLGAANVLIGRWREGKILLGRTRLRPPPDAPPFADGQPVKVVFRPEDAVLNFQPQLLDTPYYLGRAEVEEISYAGHGERLALRLLLWAPSASDGDAASGRPPKLTLVDEGYVEGFAVTVTRSKYAVDEMELSVGDEVAVGLKSYRLLPHYPLQSESSVNLFGP